MGKVRFSVEEVKETVEKFYDIKIENDVQEQATFTARVYIVKTLNNKRYIFKVFSMQEGNIEHLQLQFELMKHLTKENFVASYPVQNCKQELYSCFTAKSGDECGCFMLNYIEGKTMKIANTRQQLSDVGKYVAHLRCAMKKFIPTTHVINSQNIYAINNISEMEKHINHLEGDQKQLVTAVIRKFGEEVKPKLHRLERGYIHTDIHSDNIIILEEVQLKGSSEITKFGLIDFGDVDFSYVISELASAVAFFMMSPCEEVKDFIEVGKIIIEAYNDVVLLSEIEQEVLLCCICCKYVTELVLSSEEHLAQPDNDYLLDCLASGWPQLKELLEMSKESIDKRWFE